MVQGTKGAGHKGSRVDGKAEGSRVSAAPHGYQPCRVNYAMIIDLHSKACPELAQMRNYLNWSD